MRWQSRCGLALLLLAAPQFPGLAAGANNPPLVRTPAASFLSASGPSMLGTLAVPIKAERFGGSMQRALQDASSSPLLQRLITPARSLVPLQQIAFVQRAV